MTHVVRTPQSMGHCCEVVIARAVHLGVDVGSTTVKAVFLEAAAPEPAAADCERHLGDLAGATARVVERAGVQARAAGIALEAVRVFVTGSGARLIEARWDTAVHVHEVVAVTAAARRRHPSAGTLVELGGQDAKLVTLDASPDGDVRPEMAMNERCASGTGVTIDRCLVRLGVDPRRAAAVVWDPAKVRTVSSKCGVFAETDLVNLARRGEGPEALVISLAAAIVAQNLAVLARGRTPRADVLLLGGPHVHLPALVGAWRHHLATRWRAEARHDPASASESRRADPCGNSDSTASASPDRSGQSVQVPPLALLFAAMGACEVGTEREPREPRSLRALLDALRAPAARAAARGAASTLLDEPLARDDREARAAVALVPAPGSMPRRHGAPASRPPPILFAGIDAGSTVTKAVLVDERGDLVAAAARPSVDPIEDARGLLERLEARAGARAQALGVTGYGAGLIAPVLSADAEVVETLAHASAARALDPAADVVCDVGGQDVKVIALDRSGGIRDFRLSSQCGAGMGLLLEATARELGVPLEEIASRALAARRAPRFAESCVVFLDAARVTFQREGFSPGEILAGLARALPRVIWSYVLDGDSPAALGRVFVLQGGVQRNAAVVKAELDHLARVAPGARVVIHPHASEAGAIGAALLGARAARLRTPAGGAELRAVARARADVSIRSDESTRCRLCANECPRTFVAIRGAGGAVGTHVTGFACADGSVASEGSGLGLARSNGRLGPRRSVARRRQEVPNLLAEELRLLFGPGRRAAPLRRAPRRIRIGVPRALGLYRAAPLLRAYLEALGVGADDIAFSPVSTEALWRAGGGHGTSDPCFPVKVTLAHVHHLLDEVHDRGRPLDALLVPHVTHALTPVRHVVDSASCPVVAAAPALVRAAFGGRGGALERRGILLIAPLLPLTEPSLLRRSLHEAFAPLLGQTEAESDAAAGLGFAAMQTMDATLTARARAVLDGIERGSATNGPRAAVLVLGRPYHADPGLCHRAGEELQALGLPVLSVRSLPRDAAYLGSLFRRDLDSGAIADPFDVRDLSPECVNSGAAERLWAARFAARHGRLAVVDVSSFKCGQDAALHGAVRALHEEAGVVVCALHDLDETRPVGTLRLRLRTFAEALRNRGLLA